MADNEKSEKYFMKKAESEAMMKDQMRASAYHLKPSEVKKLIIVTTNFRDRCIIKALWWLGLRRKELVELDEELSWVSIIGLSCRTCNAELRLTPDGRWLPYDGHWTRSPFRKT